MKGWLQKRRAGRVDEAMAFEIAAEIPDVSPKLLRQALIESGVELAPMVEGVRQDSFVELERTLRALGQEYEEGDSEKRKQVRRIVITARQHADWAMRNPHSAESHREEKAEMVLWLRTWLENPPLFPAWLVLRKRAQMGRGKTG